MSPVERGGGSALGNLPRPVESGSLRIEGLAIVFVGSVVEQSIESVFPGYSRSPSSAVAGRALFESSSLSGARQEKVPKGWKSLTRKNPSVRCEARSRPSKRSVDEKKAFPSLVRASPGISPPAARFPSVRNGRYLVDPASSHMLVSKIKPCMSKYERFSL